MPMFLITSPIPFHCFCRTFSDPVEGPDFSSEILAMDTRRHGAPILSFLASHVQFSYTGIKGHIKWASSRQNRRRLFTTYSIRHLKVLSQRRSEADIQLHFQRHRLGASRSILDFTSLLLPSNLNSAVFQPCLIDIDDPLLAPVIDHSDALVVVLITGPATRSYLSPR